MASMIKVLLVAVLALMGADGGCDRKKYDVPAGSDQGDSAGNNQPDGGGLQACSMPQEIQIHPVAYVKQAGLVYAVSAYLLDEHCDVVDTDRTRS